MTHPTHKDPCCCKYGCQCRMLPDGTCNVCERKLARDLLDAIERRADSDMREIEQALSAGLPVGKLTRVF